MKSKGYVRRVQSFFFGLFGGDRKRDLAGTFLGDDAHAQTINTLIFNYCYYGLSDSITKEEEKVFNNYVDQNNVPTGVNKSLICLRNRCG